MDKRNHEGYADPTAHGGMKKLIKEEAEQDAAVHRLIHHVRYVAGLAGFEVTGRIVLKHKVTGKVFR